VLRVTRGNDQRGPPSSAFCADPGSVDPRPKRTAVRIRRAPRRDDQTMESPEGLDARGARRPRTRVVSRVREARAGQLVQQRQDFWQRSGCMVTSGSLWLERSRSQTWVLACAIEAYPTRNPQNSRNLCKLRATQSRPVPPSSGVRKTWAVAANATGALFVRQLDPARDGA
jgi:hypothetical protein